MKRRTGTWRLALSLALLGGAHAQGDSCTDATAMAGIGQWAWTNVGSTTSGYDAGGSPCYSAYTIEEDQFFLWAAPAAGSYLLSTAGTGSATSLFVYPGPGCSAPCLAAANYPSTSVGEAAAVVVAAYAGEPFLIQLGALNLPSCCQPIVSGLLSIDSFPDPPANDTCATPLVLFGEGAWYYDNLHPALQTSGFDGGAAQVCGGVMPRRDLFFVWTAFCSGDYYFDAAGTTQTLSSPILDGPRLNVHFGSDCSATCVGAADFTANGIGDERVFVSGVSVGEAYLIQVGAWADGWWGNGYLSVERDSQQCLPQLSCTQSALNSVGGAVSLGQSSQSASDGSLVIRAVGAPIGSFGLVLGSLATAPPAPFMGGDLCLSSPYWAYSPNSASTIGDLTYSSLGVFDGALAGEFSVLGFSGTVGYLVPGPLGPAAGQWFSPGETAYFQVLYRDVDASGTPTARLSDALGVQF